MNIIGLDLSLTATGVALPNGTTVTINGPAELGDQRLYNLAATLHSMMEPYGRIDLAVLEDLPIHGRGAGLTGMVQGVTRLLLIQEQIPYALAAAASLKKYATGNGGASKADMRMALYQRAGHDIHDDNQVDAWWLRHAGMDWYGTPEITMPAVQRAGLTKIRWPDLATPPPIAGS
jgi:Holliday junction resolvasome RuvABC endonuclease subunit